jgi:DNA-binding response OmpR family regulator
MQMTDGGLPEGVDWNHPDAQQRIRTAGGEPMKPSTVPGFLDIYRGRSRALAVVLFVSYDPMLLDTRSTILRAGGYLVESASTTGQAIELFREVDFDLVVLCHSIPAGETDPLIRLIRASGSTVPIVCVAPLSDHHLQTSADLVVDSRPQELLCGVEMVLMRATRQRKAKRAGELATRADDQAIQQNRAR